MSSPKNLEYKKTSFLTKANSAFIEDMYIKFINKDPSLSDSWIEYFSEINEDMQILVKEINGPSWKPFSNKIDIDEIKKTAKQNEQIKDNSDKFNFQVIANSNKNSISAVALIRAYRLSCLLYTSPSPRDMWTSRMPSSA